MLEPRVVTAIPPSDTTNLRSSVTQKSRSDAFTISKPDVSMICTFVYDKGLVGGSQPELLKHLLDELGVDDDEPRGGLKAAF
jgi:hypothetical protein